MVSAFDSASKQGRPVAGMGCDVNRIQAIQCKDLFWIVRHKGIREELVCTRLCTVPIDVTKRNNLPSCPLYTSDAADDLTPFTLGPPPPFSKKHTPLPQPLRLLTPTPPPCP